MRLAKPCVMDVTEGTQSAMAGPHAFLLAGGLFLLAAVIVLIMGSPLVAALLAVAAAGLFWYAPRAGNPSI
jgi:Flp pilus assembly protein TadB